MIQTLFLTKTEYYEERNIPQFSPITKKTNSDTKDSHISPNH
jgi:hypothetical protein